MQSASRRLCSLYCPNSVGTSYVLRTCRPNRRLYCSQMTDIVFPDPNRPDLFYHLVNPPTAISKSLPAFALSFLNHPPPRVDSSIILGWLPAETYMTDSPGISGMDHAHQTRETSTGLRDFVGNREHCNLKAFSRLTHKFHSEICNFITQDNKVRTV